MWQEVRTSVSTFELEKDYVIANEVAVTANCLVEDLPQILERLRV